jgi:hypothetical protein
MSPGVIPQDTPVVDGEAYSPVGTPGTAPGNKATGGVGGRPSDTSRAADPNVDEDGHQVRERSIPCRGCRRRTWAYDAVCEACR